MSPLVTIGIPIYKRLQYLAQGVRAVAAQDYPHVELIVSDNGQNGTRVPDIVKEAYGRPFRFRQNAETVNVIQHYNQIVAEASGEYFVMVDDDDWISPNFVSDLITKLEDHPEMALVMARQIVVDGEGREIRTAGSGIPPVMSGEAFVHGLFDYGFSNYTSFLARTKELLACGGYNDFPRGFHAETAMIVKLCLNRSIAFSQDSVFYACLADTSMSKLMDIHQLADASRMFLEFLDSDPWILAQSAKNPARWHELKARLVNMGWGGYLQRWSGMHRDKLPYWGWVRAGFALPDRPGYRPAILRCLMEDGKLRALTRMKRLLPALFRWYRSWGRDDLQRRSRTSAIQCDGADTISDAKLADCRPSSSSRSETVQRAIGSDIR